MTSGIFHPVNLDAIVVDREHRQRKELTEVDVLAESIHRLGLIHPIVITRDNILVAGERRLMACKSLGHEKINCQYVDELDDYTLRAIELEENIKRTEITWQDEKLAVLAYHELRGSVEDGWTHHLPHPTPIRQRCGCGFLGVKSTHGKTQNQTASQ